MKQPGTHRFELRTVEQKLINQKNRKKAIWQQEPETDIY